MFVDESKYTQKKTSSFFLLVGVIVKDKYIFDIETSIRELKQRYNLKNLKSLKGVDKKTKIEATEGIKRILKETDIKIVSAVIKNKGQNLDNYFKSYFFMIERFFFNVRDDYGIIIHDCLDNPKLEKRLQNKINQHILSNEVSFGDRSVGRLLDTIYPSILFIPDEHSEFIQIADLVATALGNAIWKCLNKNGRIHIEKLFEYNEYLEKYWDLFVKRPQDNKINGWGIKVWSLPILIP